MVVSRADSPEPVCFRRLRQRPRRQAEALKAVVEPLLRSGAWMRNGDVVVKRVVERDAKDK